jgi:hypothetical protein
MASLLPFRVSFFLLLVSNAAVGFAQDGEDVPYDQWVEYRGGEISLVFEATPLSLALNVISERTGIEFVIPTAAEKKQLSLRLDRLPLEPAVRSVISSLGFDNFALMYDENGRPNRVLVLGPEPLEKSAGISDDLAARNAAASSETLSAADHDTIQEDLKRWTKLNREERVRLENRLKRLPPSEERAHLMAEYGRQILGLEH